MNIFISYPSELRPTAERLRLAFIAEDHEVFFDRHDLPPAQDFDAAIRSAINASDILVYLVSPKSVAPGSYARTELKFAQNKWPHPRGRVLPVMCEATEIEQIPEYARAVTILAPDGDLVAEVTAAVAAMAQSSRSATSTKALAIGTALALAGLAAWFFTTDKPVASLNIEAFSAETRGFGGTPDVYTINGSATNLSSETHYLTGARGESGDADVAIETSLRFDNGETELEYSSGRRAAWHAQVSFTSKASGDGLTQDDLSKLKWRFCLEFVNETACTSMGSRKLNSTFSNARPLDLTATLGDTGTVVASHGENFLLARTRPAKLHSVSVDGRLLQSVDLEGEPTAIVTTHDEIVVGLQTPDSVVVIDASSFKVTARHPIAALPAAHGWGQEFTSTRINSMAVVDNLLWIVTNGGDGKDSIMYSSDWGQNWTIPRYADGNDDTLQSAMSPEGLRLRSDGNTLWGIDTTTTPSSLYQLAADTFIDFGGHEFEDVSCANDVIARERNTVTLLDCENRLVELVIENAKLKKTRTVSSLIFPRPRGPSAQQWETNHLSASRNIYVAAVQTGQISVPEFAHTAVIVKNQSEPAEIVFDQNGYSLIDLASQESAILVLLSDTTDHRLPLLFTHAPTNQSAGPDP